MYRQTRSRSRGRGSSAVVIAATALALAAVGFATGLIPLAGGDPTEGVAADERSAREADGRTSSPLSAAPPTTVEDCNRYAAEANRRPAEVVKDGALGGAIGAAVGAASGAIADDDGAGKGAAIGALVGATAGTLHGLSEENARTELARAAYQECMADHGYSG